MATGTARLPLAACWPVERQVHVPAPSLADVFPLGATRLCAATGHAPYLGDTTMRACTASLSRP